ncbi:redox-sensing transcriptional repressor Rex [Parasphaerochaeta coccoides]|uniref:Redox-sensing transcriptional repressor Rex n=1 Tax=Parasphaerochaeta coccoides (strain ATCC BAA-1237 / DSM 17374 / SPN1) TaxID=760011 RepID=F4GKP2_PARC1|nr:redox-sensing transcriptional repressor Rex [Parasphaerochaeta coccoides]AEC01451.1 Redox-sensing transcriptional repressor rex [Parasphaerochaeta coccoides DSM 17374]
MIHKTLGPIPVPTIKRLPSYLRVVKQYKSEGVKWVSATMIAEELRLTPIQVRKDISCTGIEGRPKVGFQIDDLIDAIIYNLGWDNTTDAIIVGAGHLGQALAGYEGFDSYGLRIIGAFDHNKKKVGGHIGKVEIYHVDTMESFVLNNRIRLGVIAVPAKAAQDIATRMADCGILGIWNFAPRDLKVPDGVILQRTDLATSFAVISAKLRREISVGEYYAPIIDD